MMATTTTDYFHNFYSTYDKVEDALKFSISTLYKEGFTVKKIPNILVIDATTVASTEEEFEELVLQTPELKSNNFVVPTGTIESEQCTSIGMPEALLESSSLELQELFKYLLQLNIHKSNQHTVTLTTGTSILTTTILEPVINPVNESVTPTDATYMPTKFELADLFQNVDFTAEVTATSESHTDNLRIEDYKISLKATGGSVTEVAGANRYFNSVSTLYKEAIAADTLQVTVVQDIIESAIETKGMTKRASLNPSKRMHLRNMILDKDECYLSNVESSGTDIDIVLILDRSGSMQHRPARDSNILCGALNELADGTNFKVSLLYSDSKQSCLLDLPVGHTEELLAMTSTYGAEGIAENLKEHEKRIEKASLVFVYTDGDICSDPVDKSYYTAKGIPLIALYTTDDELTVTAVNKHYKTNKAWFHHVLVSNTVEQLAEKMVEYLQNIKY